MSSLVNSKLNSSPLSSLFPLRLFRPHERPRHPLRHQPTQFLAYSFDRFSLENYNSVIFAKSGSGKSYATKLEILRSLMFGTDVIVIDPEREYDQLAEATGGRSFRISLSSEHHINPFDLPPVKEDEDPKDILRSNIIALVGLFRIMLSGLSPEEDAIVDRAISETYALKDITGDADFTGAEPPLLSDFEQVLSGMEGSESLVERLSKYTRGTWAGFLNQPTNIDLKQQFAVFSVRDMEDELKARGDVYHHALYLECRAPRNEETIARHRRGVVDDEERRHRLPSSIPSPSADVSIIWASAPSRRTLRTSSKSPYGRPILTNSSLQLLLKQSPTTIDVLQQTFNLTDEEKYLLLEAGVGEGLFFAGLKHVAIKVVASYTEDQIITSDPSQLLAIKEGKERHAAQDKQ